MNNFEIVILALALVFNSWTTYLNAGIVLCKEHFWRKVHYVALMFFFQFLMTGVGIWMGNRVGGFELRVNMLISLSILLFIGLKVLLTNIRTQNEENKSDNTVNKVVWLAALTEGINPLVVGSAIGLLSVHPYLHWTIIGIFLLVAIVSALIAGTRKSPGTPKLQAGTIGGFLLLAIALKLILSLTSFGI